MKKLTEEQREKIKAGLELLCEENTTIDKVKKISELLKGTNPVVDNKLKDIFEVIDKLQKVQQGDVITLSAENLPEKDESSRKRKKLLLLLIKNWKDLHSEIGRIQELQQAAEVTGTVGNETVVKTGKILATAKGPLGLVTIAAAAVVAIGTLLNNNSVNIKIVNSGCSPIKSVVGQKIDFPGLKLPGEDIVSGKEGVAVLPGINLSIDATSGRAVSVTAFDFSKKFNLPGEIKDVIFDGKSILGRITQLKLSDAKDHEIIIKCGTGRNG